MNDEDVLSFKRLPRDMDFINNWATIAHKCRDRYYKYIIIHVCDYDKHSKHFPGNLIYSAKNRANFVLVQSGYPNFQVWCLNSKLLHKSSKTCI